MRAFFFFTGKYGKSIGELERKSLRYQRFTKRKIATGISQMRFLGIWPLQRPHFFALTMDLHMELVLTH